MNWENSRGKRAAGGTLSLRQLQLPYSSVPCLYGSSKRKRKERPVIGGKVTQLEAEYYCSKKSSRSLTLQGVLQKHVLRARFTLGVPISSRIVVKSCGSLRARVQKERLGKAVTTPRETPRIPKAAEIWARCGEVPTRFSFCVTAKRTWLPAGGIPVRHGWNASDMVLNGRSAGQAM